VGVGRDEQFFFTEQPDFVMKHEAVVGASSHPGPDFDDVVESSRSMEFDVHLVNHERPTAAAQALQAEARFREDVGPASLTVLQVVGMVHHTLGIGVLEVDAEFPTVGRSVHVDAVLTRVGVVRERQRGFARNPLHSARWFERTVAALVGTQDFSLKYGHHASSEPRTLWRVLEVGRSEQRLD